ncbi:PaaI family thioesterase [Allorhizobium terrae]|uniref:PaaI family thioesterase n=1 Tax=Allorhizobium terrae TaxID=1848972 RepID=A0A4S4A291_9HYPH|nr:PaaI family thioesterase [Allorhizobium terrae]THF52350.1 PaaI family thioesterase [Allorhizobium terrae]TWD57434.1 uncharacterized protein (TIGR00369 family) [Agrobacterium vitis]
MPNQPVMTIETISAFLDTHFPQLQTGGKHFKVTKIGAGTATLQLDPDTHHLRPGGTVSGPSLFTLADVGCWIAILAQVGPIPMVVTTNLNINFLRLPKQAPLDCDCRILKLGKRLAVVDALIHQGCSAEPVAQATATYSIPPR